MFKTLLDLHSKLDKDQFELLLKTCDNDIVFHKSIGCNYTDELLKGVITTAGVVVVNATT